MGRGTKRLHDYGGEGDLKGPKKGLRNQSIAPYLQKIKIFLGKEFTAPCLEN